MVFAATSRPYCLNFLRSAPILCHQRGCGRGLALAEQANYQARLPDDLPALAAWQVPTSGDWSRHFAGDPD